MKIEAWRNIMKLAFCLIKEQRRQCYLGFYSAKHVPTISYKQSKNRGIVLIQTGQQVEHLQSCIMTSQRARDASRQHEGTAESLDASSDEERTFYHLQIHFTQMLYEPTGRTRGRSIWSEHQAASVEFVVIFHCPPAALKGQSQEWCISCSYEAECSLSESLLQHSEQRSHVRKKNN